MARPHRSSHAFCPKRKERDAAGGQHEDCDNSGSCGGSWKVDWKTPAHGPWGITCPRSGRKNQLLFQDRITISM